jgi:hypothetical protein
MTASENPVRHCPKCGSVRVRGSRRRGPLEAVIASLGGEICRCHDCCSRKAWFGVSPFPLGNRDPEGSPWVGIVMIGFVGAVFVAVVWITARFAR